MKGSIKIPFGKLRIGELFTEIKQEDFRIKNPVLMKMEELEETNSIYIEGRTGRVSWKFGPEELVNKEKATIVIE